MKIVVTAGPTREHLDPVRFLSNPSTGKMGFAVAAEAARRGHAVTLIAGPVALATPKGVKRVDVTSAREMLKAVKRAKGELLIAVAAVADWRPAKCAKRKLKKREMEGTLKLVRNPDILKSVRGMKKIGFAAETNDVIEEAARKCQEKRLEFIVANDVSRADAGFGSDLNRVAFVYPNGEIRRFPLMTKLAVAKRIVDEIARI